VYYRNIDTLPVKKVELNGLGLRVGEKLLKMTCNSLVNGLIEAVVRLEDNNHVIELDKAHVEVNGKNVLPVEIGLGTERTPGIGHEMITSNVIKVTFITDQDKWIKPTAAQLMRYKIQNQLMSGSRWPKKYLNQVKQNDPESKARKLLREIIGDVVYRTYLKNGFLTVQGKSGLIYKIMRGTFKESVRVLAPLASGGYAEFSDICIGSKRGTLPPTDDVITRMMMAIGDERGLHRIGNSWRLNDDQQFLLSPEAVEITGYVKDKQNHIFIHSSIGEALTA
jgi:hypothetical protein